MIFQNLSTLKEKYNIPQYSLGPGHVLTHYCSIILTILKITFRPQHFISIKSRRNIGHKQTYNSP